MKITAETAIEDVLAEKRSKALLVRLAQTVFDRPSIDCFRAFSQFRDVNDLAALIEAKRKNVFNYAACIRNTDTGVVYPKDTSAVLGALAKAIDGRYEEIDLRHLGLVDGDGEPLVQLRDLCPGAGAKPKKTAKPKKAAKPKPAKSPVTGETPKASKRVKSKQAPPPESEEPKTSVLLGSADVLNELSGLRKDLTDALDTIVKESKKSALRKDGALEDKISYVKDELDKVKGGILGLAAFLHVVNENIATLFAYIDPEEELAGPPPVVLALLEGAVPDGYTASDDVEVPTSGPAEEAHEDEPGEETGSDVEEATGSDVEEEVSYTREDLQSMSLQDLRELAEKVGVANASSIPYRTSLITRVMKTLGS